MTPMSKTIVFFGTDSFSVPALEALIAAHHPIGAIITKPDSKQGRGQQVTAPKVKSIGLQYNIPVWQPERLIDIVEDIKALGPSVGVLSSYGKIVPQSVIELFDPGIINIHPSLLPKYRGPSPIEAAINNGDEQTGVSIMKIKAAMDAGPLYKQKTVPLDGTETQPELIEKLAHIGADMLIEVIPEIISGQLTPTEQTGEASYCHLLTKDNSLLDLSKLTAKQAEQKIRAHLSFPKSKLALNSQIIIITKAHVSSERTSLLDQTCQDDQFLVIDELIGPSGRTMSGKDFLNGYAAG